MREHTPGPWEAEVFEGLWVTGPDRDAPVICDLVSRDADAYTDEDEANARLIAAAPDLLAALELAVRYIEHPDVQAMPFSAPAATAADRIRGAIRKATEVES